MKKRSLALGITLTLAALAVPGAASADLAESTRGPLYVQGAFPLALGYGHAFTGAGSAGFSNWKPDMEFGAHFTGRHDGFVLGLRQEFHIMELPNAAGATTVVKLGYDIPIPVSDFEITIGPYGTFGVNYIFDGPHAGIHATGGIDGKFFFYEGLYAFARPFEMGFQCLHDVGNCALWMEFGAGIGFAFPNVK